MGEYNTDTYILVKGDGSDLLNWIDKSHSGKTDMTNREQLIQELEQAPDDVVQTMLDFLHRVKAARENHPLAEFIGILSDSEAEELQRSVAEGRQVDFSEW